MARSIAHDHDEKRTAILRAAAKVFATEGFDRASMTRLARECGISKANIYHYYTSKDAILFDVLDGYLSHLRDRITGLDLAGDNPDAVLRKVICETLFAYQGADYEHRVQMGGVELLPAEQQRVLKGYQREIVEFFSDILEKAAPAAFEGQPEKLRQATMAVFGMLNWYFMWNSGAGRAAREEYAGLVADMTLKGIKGID
ncbi:MAG TPA: TetR family transcriptional regulator [Maritimibacter sp.]|nr:TetR family transcriptional regulator [Maritimibacter sp.]